MLSAARSECGLEPGGRREIRDDRPSHRSLVLAILVRRPLALRRREMVDAGHAKGARRLVDLVQLDAGFEELAERTLDVLDSLVGFDTGLLLHFGGEKQLICRHLDEEQLHYARLCHAHYETRYAESLAPIFRQAHLLGGCLTEDAYSESALERTVLHQEILRPSKIRSAIHLCASWRGQPLLRINLTRHGIQRFRPAELERALALLPTIEICHASILGTSPTGPDLGALLSPRELEVTKHVARGLSNPQIARVLGISPITVRNLLVRTFDKLRISSRAELAALVGQATPAPHSIPTPETLKRQPPQAPRSPASATETL